MTGALIEQEMESGLIRGAAIGAISSAIFSLEVFESSVLLWRCDESGIGCLLYLIDVIVSLSIGRLAVGPDHVECHAESEMGIGVWYSVFVRIQSAATTSVSTKPQVVNNGAIFPFNKFNSLLCSPCSD